MDPNTLPKFLRDLKIKDTTWILYGLWGGSVLIHFLPLLAVALWYVKRPSAAGTIYESHFEWVIRTFAIGLVVGITLGVFVALLKMEWMAPVVGILFALWGLYRLVKGIARLSQNSAVENPKSFI